MSELQTETNNYKSIKGRWDPRGSRVSVSATEEAGGPVRAQNQPSTRSLTHRAPRTPVTAHLAAGAQFEEDTAAEFEGLQEEPAEGFQVALVDAGNLYNPEVAISGTTNTY